MKYRLAKLLRCTCGAPLRLIVLREETVRRDDGPIANPSCLPQCSPGNQSDSEGESQEVLEGLFQCTLCAKLFPIIRGIPRMLNDSMAVFAPDLVPHASRLRGEFGIELPRDLTGYCLDQEYRQVRTHFSVQWEKFAALKRSFGMDVAKSLDYLLWTLTPRDVGVDYFQHKLVLDAGCGHGKYVMGMAHHPIEIVGMDISSSVEFVYARTKHLRNTHILQGDVIAPPFPPHLFDFVYSNGVIHHTPDTRQAFKSLARLPKSGTGIFSIWVYPFRSWLWEQTQTVLRAITTRLPPGLLYRLCYLPVPLLHVFKAYSGTNLSNSSWRECAQVVFDFYGPKYQTHHTPEEVLSWYEEEGYARMELGPSPLSATGYKKAS